MLAKVANETISIRLIDHFSNRQKILRFGHDRLGALQTIQRFGRENAGNRFPKIVQFLFVIFPPESVWEKDYFAACLLAQRPLPRSVRRFHAHIQATRLPARRPPPRSVRRFRAS